MNRQKTIRNLLLLMENLGRAMFKNKFEHIKPGTPTSSQMEILLFIDVCGCQNAKELADRTYVTPSGISQSVNILVNNGFLTRQGDQKDRRMIRLELTKKANNFLRIESETRLKNRQFIFSRLSDDELVELEKIHRKINEHLDISLNDKNLKK